MKKSALLFTGIGLVLLSALFLWLQPPPPAPALPAAAAPAAAIPEQAPAAPAVAEVQVFEWVVKNGQRVSGPELVSVKVNDRVSLRLLSDRADELHLHGYDLHGETLADQPAMLGFVAEHAGRFGIELHKSGIELATLEVLPQ